MSSSDSDLELDKAGLSNLLPPKSQVKYLQAYETFANWKKQNQKDELDESIFVEYFTKLSKERKPSSLWSIYSMLKCTVRIKHNLNLQSYTNLIRFLKKKSQGYKSATTKILTQENIKKFLNDAPDEIYLATKVGLIFGICGACRSGELCKLTTKNIQKHGEVLVVNLCDSQYNTERVFVIREEFAAVVQKYQALRPKNVETDRFFLKYSNGKCVKQVIGVGKISSMPKDIAIFLKLPNPKLYTGHCFRRSSSSSGVSAITGQKRQTKFGSDPADLMDFSIDAHNERQKIDKAVKTVEKQKNETDGDYEDTADEYNREVQDVQVEIEENPNSSAKSLRHVRVTRSFASSATSELDMDFDREPDDLGEDPIHIKTENDDEIINLRPQSDLWGASQPSGSKEKVHVTSDDKNTNIRVAGKNISIIFKNCAHVGNITINIVKD